MATRNNGTVQSASSNGAAVVAYETPPSPVTYTDLTDAEREVMLAAFTANAKVDVTTDDTVSPPDVTGVVCHR